MFRKAFQGLAIVVGWLLSHHRRRLLKPPKTEWLTAYSTLALLSLLIGFCPHHGVLGAHVVLNLFVSSGFGI
jgi:hypothetical protein